MKRTHDAYEDPEMAALLRRRGGVAGRDPAEGPSRREDAASDDELSSLSAPGDLSALRERLLEVDARIDAERGRLRQGAWTVLLRKPVLALAAGVALLVTGGWLVRMFMELPRGSRAAIVLSDATLSTRAERTRGESVVEHFSSGDCLYLHFESTREGVVSVVVLNSAMQLGLVDGRTDVAVGTGPNSVGQFCLDDRAGLETFFLVALSQPVGSTTLTAWVEQAGASATRVESREAKTRAIQKSLEQQSGAPVTLLTIEHRP